MNRIPVVIPYLASAAQGRELEYAVAGWRKHAKFPFTLVIVGDYHPIVTTGEDIVFMNCPQVPEPEITEYRCHLDHVHKFRRVREAMDLDWFIYACDDMYAVNDFTMDDILCPKYLEADMLGNPLDPNGWQRDMWKTRKICVDNDLPVVNWVCHLPVLYGWGALEDIYSEFDCDHHSCIVENVYFNKLYRRGLPRDAVKIDGNDQYRLGLYSGDYTAESLQAGASNKIWVCNSPEGWTDILDNFLKQHYTDDEN